MVGDSQVALLDGSGHLGEVSCDGKSYTQRLTKKIQEQAALLQDQALQLEWAGKYARECEDKIKELDPGVEIPLRLWGTNSPLRSVLKVDSNPSNVISTIARHRQETARAQDAINKLERKAREAEQKLETERRGARELRKQSEKHVKDLNVAKLRADKLSELLAACEDAKRCAADQVRRLEYKYESSDKGAALLRAAKADSDLEQERRHREALESASKQQELRIQELQDTVQELSASLEVAAAELQLGGGGSQLRRLAGDSRQLAEAQRMLQVKDKELADAQADAQQMLQRTRQFAQLQDSCNEIAGRCKELEEQVVAGASDRSALLDHVQDLEASKNALQERADSLQAKAAQQQAQLDALLNGRLHGHSPADIQVQELLKAKEHELMDAKLKASVSNASLEVLQQQLHATQDKLEEAHCTKGEAERQAFASQLQLQELRAELQTCVQQRNRLQEQLGAGHNAVEGLERQLAQLRQQRADARQETERLQAEHQALQSGQELLQQQLQQATAREAEASGQLVEAGGRCEELQQKLSHYESLLPDILRLGRELNALLQRQPASAAAASSPTPAAAADMVLSCLAECADSIRSLLSERQALQNDLDYAKASGEELSQQVQQLSAELASKAARCGELAASLEDSTTQLNAAESEVHRLRQELQEEREKGRSAALQLQLAADERCSDMQRLLHQAELREQQANKRAIEAEGAAAEAGRKAAAGQLEVEAAAAREEALAAQLSGSLEVQSRVEQMLPASQQQPAAGCDVSGDALVARLALALEEGRAAQGRADGHAADCRRMVAEREGLRGQVAALEGERDRLQEALRRERLESGPVLEARAQQLTQLGKQMEALASEKGRAQWELSQALKRAQEVADLAEGAQADAAAATQEADAARQRAEVRLQEAERQHAEEAAELHAQLLQHQQTVAAQAATLHGREEDLQAAQRQLLELRGRLLVEGDPDAAAVLRAELSPGPASPPPQMVRGAHGADAPGSPAGALHSTATVQAGDCSPVLAATGTVMSGRSSPDTAAAPGPSWTATLEVKSSGLHSPVPGPQLRSTPAAAAPTSQRLSRAAARRRAAGGASQLDRYADLVLSSGSPYVQQLAQHGSDGSNPPSPTSHLPPRTAATRIADPRPSPSASPHSAAISPCPAAGSPASAPPARRTSFLRQPPSALLQAAQPRSHARSSRPLPSNPAKPTPAAAAGAGGQRSSLRSPSVTEASLQKRLREVQQLRRRFDDM